MPPLKKAPSPIMIGRVVTSPVNEPSLRMSTRSLALTLPRTVPRTTTSRAVIFPNTCAYRPTVTRLSGRLIAPSTLPSMYKDSEPITSPLTCKLLPIVAGSVAASNVGAAWEEHPMFASSTAATDSCDRVNSSSGNSGVVCRLLLISTNGQYPVSILTPASLHHHSGNTILLDAD
jgi:hypothetical protein